MMLKMANWVNAFTTSLNIKNKRARESLSRRIHSGFCYRRRRCEKQRPNWSEKAPDLIRRALANLAWHKDAPLYDLGTVVCDDDLLEESQSRCANLISEALPHTPTIVLGADTKLRGHRFLV